MAMLYLRDKTRDRINALIKVTEKPNPFTRITQDYIITKALDLLDGGESNDWWIRRSVCWVNYRKN